MRTIKEEVIWLHEFTSLAEVKELIGSWFEKYNCALVAERNLNRNFIKIITRRLLNGLYL